MTEHELLKEIKYWLYSFIQYGPLYVIAGLAHVSLVVIEGKPIPRKKILASIVLGCFATWAFMILFRLFGWNGDFSAIFATGTGSAGAVGFYILQTASLTQAKRIQENVEKFDKKL